MNDIDDKSIDMILCDLPYGITQNEWDIPVDINILWNQYKRVIKNNGVIALTAIQPFTSYLIMSNIKMFKYEWIWSKSICNNFWNVNKQPLRKHENIIIFYNGKSTYNPNDIIIGNFKSKRGNIGSNYGIGKNEWITDKKNYPKSIIEIKSEGKKIHPTQKPVALFEYLIKTYTNENEMVLDNCIGSGTTAIACKNTKRKFIGIEKEQKYFDIANKRINEYKS